MSIYDRSFYLKYAAALSHPGDFSSNIAIFFGEDADINVVHPRIMYITKQVKI